MKNSKFGRFKYHEYSLMIWTLSLWAEKYYKKSSFTVKKLLKTLFLWFLQMVNTSLSWVFQNQRMMSQSCQLLFVRLSENKLQKGIRTLQLKGQLMKVLLTLLLKMNLTSVTLFCWRSIEKNLTLKTCLKRVICLYLVLAHSLTPSFMMMKTLERLLLMGTVTFTLLASLIRLLISIMSQCGTDFQDRYEKEQEISLESRKFGLETICFISIMIKSMKENKNSLVE